MVSRNLVSVAALVAVCAWLSCSALVAQVGRAQGANAAVASHAISKNEHGLDIVRNPYTGNAGAIAEGMDLFASSA